MDVYVVCPNRWRYESFELVGDRVSFLILGNSCSIICFMFAKYIENVFLKFW